MSSPAPFPGRPAPMPEVRAIDLLRAAGDEEQPTAAIGALGDQATGTPPVLVRPCGDSGCECASRAHVIDPDEPLGPDLLEVLGFPGLEDDDEDQDVIEASAAMVRADDDEERATPRQIDALTYALASRDNREPVTPSEVAAWHMAAARVELTEALEAAGYAIGHVVSAGRALVGAGVRAAAWPVAAAAIALGA